MTTIVGERAVVGKNCARSRGKEREKLVSLIIVLECAGVGTDEVGKNRKNNLVRQRNWLRRGSKRRGCTVDLKVTNPGRFLKSFKGLSLSIKTSRKCFSIFDSV